MKKRILFVITIFVIIIGLFFAIQYRQRVGFYVAGAAVLGLIYFIFFE